MDYFNSASTSHSLRFIYRSFNPIVYLTIYHELTNKRYYVDDLECVLTEGYAFINFNFEFIQNGTYTIEINGSGGGSLMYRSKAKAV